MRPIPLTRSRHVTNFLVALDQIGMPFEPFLSSAHLPQSLIEDRAGNGMVSAINMLDLAQHSALKSGVLDLGIRAGEMPLSGYGEFGRRVVAAPTLHGAIREFCDNVRSECSEADYYLLSRGETARFCHGPLLGTPVQQQQHELYAAMIMTQVIRLAMGEHWHPRRLLLQTTIKTDLADNPFLSKVTIDFGAPITAVEFPAKHLAKTLGAGQATHSGSEQAGSSIHFDPMIALHNAIEDCISRSEKPTIDKAADAMGISTRTLQRYLNNKATSYSNLLEQVRLDVAMPLLSDSSTSMTEIAYALGYANLSHFSRAIKRITGLSPRAYRKTLRSEEVGNLP